MWEDRGTARSDMIEILISLALLKLRFSLVRTLGLMDVRCFSGGSVEPLSYKYPHSLLCFSCTFMPPGCENPTFVSVCCEFVSFWS